MCAAEPDGILSALVTFDVPAFIFGIEPVQAVIDYKFRTFARAVLKTELAIYVALMVAFTFYLRYTKPALTWFLLERYGSSKLKACIAFMLNIFLWMQGNA